MLRDLHYSLTRFAKYRSHSRRMIRYLKNFLGCPDPWEYILRLLREHPDAIYLDIGAHVGATIERIADECDNLIHGFEPTPDSFQKLQTRFSGSKQVHIWNVACSNRTGKSYIFLNSNSQTNSLLDNNVGNQKSFPIDTIHTGQLEIPTVTLDDWLKEVSIDKNRPIIVKCDVQGAELKVIEGALAALKNQCLAFYSEIQLIDMYAEQATFAQVNQTLTEGLGFVIKDIYPCLHDASGKALQCDIMWAKPSAAGCK